MFKAVIFDLDDTLYEYTSLNDAAVSHVESYAVMLISRKMLQGVRNV